MRNVPPRTHTISPRIDNLRLQDLTVGEHGASRLPYGRFRWSSWPDAYEISAPAGLREDDDKRGIEGQLATFQARGRGRTTRWRASADKDLRSAS
jgi:hypothetical protein